MAKINHNLFGEISYDLYWSGEQKVRIFGQEKNIILSIDGSETGEFQDAQEDAYRNFVNNMDRLMNDIEEAIFDYYQEVYMDYRDMLGEEDADKLVPIVEDKEKMASLVTPTELVIRRVRKNGVRRVGLLFDCTWEVEHGLGVKIEDEKITEVGFQDIVL